MRTANTIRRRTPPPPLAARIRVASRLRAAELRSLRETAVQLHQQVADLHEQIAALAADLQVAEAIGDMWHHNCLQLQHTAAAMGLDLQHGRTCALSAPERVQ